MEAVNQLRNIVKFFSTTKGLKSSIGMINHISSLLAKSVLKLEEEFRQLLNLYRSVILKFSLYFLRCDIDECNVKHCLIHVKSLTHI